MTDIQPMLVPVAESMRILGIGRTKLYALIDAGDLERVHIGTKALVTITSIESYVARLRQAA